MFLLSTDRLPPALRRHGRPALVASFAFASLVAACTSDRPEEPIYKAGRPPTVAAAATLDGTASKLLEQANASFSAPLPPRVAPAGAPGTEPGTEPGIEAGAEAQIDLGRMLYHEPRLSKNHDISCNSCHSLTDYGIDVRAPADQRQVSTGHQGQKGGRNSPTVYNAALHFRQFWDGRAADLTEQAKGPVLNPVEMAMPDEQSVVARLKSIPGYVEAFRKAFPGDAEPVTYENMARAIAAFEEGLITPAPLDDFLRGQLGALNEQQLRGLGTFIEVGCTTCHNGPALGGNMYQKLGLLKPYATKDQGRYEVTQDDAERFWFKVPSLRNITRTGPYLHDGSIADLERMVAIMAEHQTPRGALSESEIADIVAFLDSLTGAIPSAYIAAPALPPSGP